MSKRYTVLQKKLEELESELNQAFALPVETSYHQLLSDAFDQKFVFLNNLLAAETKSHPRKPHHLRHIAERLKELEAAFRDWDNFRTSSLNHIDTASTCSCTESCLNDDGGGSIDLELPVYEDPESISEGLVDEKQTGETVKTEPEGGVMEGENGRGVSNRKNGGVMAGVVMFSGVLMGVVMAWFAASGNYYIGFMEPHLPPT